VPSNDDSASGDRKQGGCDCREKNARGESLAQRRAVRQQAPIQKVHSGLLRFPLGSVAEAARENRSPDWRDFKADRFGGSFPMR
jgi:hypothetical protein